MEVVQVLLPEPPVGLGRRPCDTEFLHPVAQGVGMEAEDLGGAASSSASWPLANTRTVVFWFDRLTIHGKEAPMRDDPPSNPSNPSRRAFLRTTGDTAAAAVIAVCAPAHTAGQSAAPAARVDGPNIAGAIPVTLRINGKDRQLRVDPRTTL